MKMSIYVIFYIVCIFVGSLFAQNLFDTHIENADKLIKEETYEAAIEELKKAVEVSRTPDEKCKALNAIGWSYFSLGDNENARIFLIRANSIAQNEKYADLAKRVANNLGILEYTAGDLEKAKLHFNSPWAKDSETASTYLSIIEKQNILKKVNNFLAAGMTFRMNKEFEKAIIEYQKALDIDPNDERALEYIGYSLFRIGKYILALEKLNKAYRINPARINVLINLMKVNCALGRQQAVLEIVMKNQKFFSENDKILKQDGELKRVCKSMELDLLD